MRICRSNKTACKMAARLLKGRGNIKFFHWLARPYIKCLMERGNMTCYEAVVFSICSTHPGYDIRDYLGISDLDYFLYNSAKDSLCEKGFIVKSTIKNNVIDRMLKENIINSNFLTNSRSEFIRELDIVFDRAKPTNYVSTQTIVKNIVEQSKFDFAVSVRKMGLLDADLVLYLYLCLRSEKFGEGNCERITSLARAGVIEENRDSYYTTCEDIANGLVDHKSMDGIKDIYQLSLSEKGKKLFYGDSRKPNIPNMTMPDDIKNRELFFDEETRSTIDEIMSLLRVDSYQAIIARMDERNMRKGIAILFYGLPGTGKTECALQICKRSNRGIVKVDMSKIRDKYVGNSEKNVKAIFDSYRECSKKCDTTPVLFLNEADAILGNRITNTSEMVDKVENSLQNIILDEMERFEGIMIATTNFQQNFDPAFERRFLFKVKFEKPSVETRAMIWQSNLPFLSGNEADELARKYDFSGGEVENVARKVEIDYILHGAEVMTFENVRSICNNEKIQNSNKRTVGFH